MAKQLSFSLALVIVAACAQRYEGFTDRQPSMVGIAGEYFLTRESAALISELWGSRFAQSRLVLRSDGTFESSQDAIFGAAPPNEPTMAGRWRLFRDPEGWAVRFEATTSLLAGKTNFLLIKNDAPPYELHMRMTDGILVYAQRR